MDNKKLEQIFTKDYIAKLENLSKHLKDKVPVGGAYKSGERRTQTKGSSMEFSDFREYEEGDDLRLVDWNSYARFEKMYIKLYLAEIQGEVNIFLDCSHSMDFNDEKNNKFTYAKIMVASLVYMAISNGDNVNIFLWNEKIFNEKRNISRKNQFNEIIMWLDDIKCDSGTILLKSLLYVSNIKKGLSVIVSDFLAEIPIVETISLLQTKKQDVALLQVLSEEEVSPKEGECLRMIDAETGEIRDMELTALVIKSYKKVFKSHQNALKETAFKKGCGFISVAENDDIILSIRKML